MWWREWSGDVCVPRTVSHSSRDISAKCSWSQTESDCGVTIVDIVSEEL